MLKNVATWQYVQVRVQQHLGRSDYEPEKSTLFLKKKESHLWCIRNLHACDTVNDIRFDFSVDSWVTPIKL
jgi:hypothetical protein